MSKVDYLDQDPEIRGQKYVCLSFVSPEDVIKQKEVYMFEKFMTAMSFEVKALWEQMYENFKDNIDFTDSLRKIEERHPYVFQADKLHEEYKSYKAVNAKDLDVEYLEQNDFQTSIRGIKVRGSYETLREAEIRAQVLKRIDTVHNIFIAEVGCWCPWAPNPDEISDSEYAESSLNTLMKSYVDNQAEKDAFYTTRKEELKDKALESNKIKQRLIEKENETGDMEVGTQIQDEIEVEDPWMQRKQESDP
jgi:hypothetical protein